MFEVFLLTNRICQTSLLRRQAATTATGINIFIPQGSVVKFSNSLNCEKWSKILSALEKKVLKHSHASLIMHYFLYQNNLKSSFSKRFNFSLAVFIRQLLFLAYSYFSSIDVSSFSRANSKTEEKQLKKLSTASTDFEFQIDNLEITIILKINQF